jgi:hypothetical protein
MLHDPQLQNFIEGLVSKLRKILLSIFPLGNSADLTRFRMCEILHSGANTGRFVFVNIQKELYIFVILESLPGWGA